MKINYVYKTFIKLINSWAFLSWFTIFLCLEDRVYSWFFWLSSRFLCWWILLSEPLSFSLVISYNFSNLFFFKWWLLITNFILAKWCFQEVLLIKSLCLPFFKFLMILTAWTSSVSTALIANHKCRHLAYKSEHKKFKSCLHFIFY